MNTWGNAIRVEIFGESHGASIGVILDGIPAGVAIDQDLISTEMARRAPGRSTVATQRREDDTPQILSGVNDGFTTGAPIACIIDNTNARSQDYDTFLRPGHADWTARIKYGKFADLAGGGHFSGRITAPLVFAGAIAKMILASKGIRVFARICSIGGVKDDMDVMEKPLDMATIQNLIAISAKFFPASEQSENAFHEEIKLAMASGDSVGGTIEVIAAGALAGLGEPFFGSVESALASLYFSIPAVKGVEFGKGFALSAMRGSASNDPLYVHSGSIYSKTNRCGGILGGITNGMPIVARVAIKPTASIHIPQETVDGDPPQNVIAINRGRHDPCIVPRAVPVIEACTALGLLDLIQINAGRK